jgi:hypothetical protein
MSAWLSLSRGMGKGLWHLGALLYSYCVLWRAWLRLSPTKRQREMRNRHRGAYYYHEKLEHRARSLYVYLHT